MSSISQNTFIKSKVDKVNMENEDVSDVKIDACNNEEVNNGTEQDALYKKNKRKRKSKSSKENQSELEQKQEMKQLEDLLFGPLHSLVDFGKESEELEEQVAPLFFMDKSRKDDALSCELANFDETDYKISLMEKKPVWVDEEEENRTINLTKVNRLRKLRREEGESIITGADYVARLRTEHNKLNPCTNWAQFDMKTKNLGLDDDSDVEEDRSDIEADILQSNENFIEKRGIKLLPGIIEYSRVKDANAEDPSNACINSVEFHCNGQLLLAAGLDRRVRFFQIDGKRNPKIQSIFIDDCPIRKASFLPNGSQVIVGGRRKFFYTIDLIKENVDKIGPLVGRDEASLEVFEVSPDSNTIAFIGNEGYILLVSSKTKELIGTLKMNGTARSLAFADNGHQLLSSGGDGHIYHWDLRTRKCIHKAIDEGCVTGSALGTSPDGKFFAAGSTSGIVNVYNRYEFLGGKRKPLKTIDNLVAKVDSLKFNNDAQILAICSNMQKNGLKLVHVPSFTVYSNWPPPYSNLHSARCMDFSPGSGFMAVGNTQGKVLLYKLHHYQRA